MKARGNGPGRRAGFAKTVDERKLKDGEKEAEEVLTDRECKLRISLFITESF